MPHRILAMRLVFLAVLALSVTGCGGGAPTGDVDKIEVVQSQFDIAVTNTSGRALFEVRAAIVPVGPGSHFTALVARMESGERRVLAHNLFSDRDGVPFSARSHKAKAVAVSAKDMDGKALQVEMPWKH